MGKTTVVHIKDNPDWKEKGYVYIGRGTIFGNPYPISAKQGWNRDKVISMYRNWFDMLIRRDNNFQKDVRDLAGKTLVCHCAPKACHGNVIAEWLNRQ